MKLAKITLAENENSYKCSSCIVYTVLFWIFFTINIGGIGAYFVYFHWHLKKIFTCVEFNTCTQTDIYYTYKWEKLNKLTLKIKLIIFNFYLFLFFNLKDFDASLVKIDKKNYKEIDIYYIGYVTVKKIANLIIVTILIV